MKASFAVRTAAIAGLTLAAGLGSFAQNAGMKSPFVFNGMYLEGCSCAAPCPCELTGVAMGCEGVGLFVCNSGSFKGKDISGTKMAYGVAPGSWVTIYVDAPTDAKRNAITDMAKTALKDFGKLESVKSSKIAVTGKAGSYTATVDSGKIMKLVTKPTLGGDGKNPMEYRNIKNPIHPNVMQGSVVSCTFKDGSHTFTLKDTNAYFHPKIASKGRL